MCGINAFLSYQKINNSIIDKIRSCNNDMIYRGPNEQDVWFNEKICFGQVRLSIIGVDNGHQPLFNEDKSIVLICNGEIYNYKKLKKDLEKKGHCFISSSDSEVILHLYEEYGEDLNSKLDGMFAYCLFDLNNEKLIVGRDIAGIKPLYYSKTSEGIIFSSELKVIKKHFINSPVLNYEVLRQTQVFSYSISPECTYINGIKKIPFSSFATVSKENGYNIHIEKYFQRTIKNKFLGDYNEACVEVKRLLYNAVDKRLQSEVPLGVLLSAGIDSSSVAVIAKEFREEVNVLSAGYVGKHSVDERKEAKRLSDQFGFVWNEIELDQNDYVNNLHKILPILDEPNGDVAMFAQWDIYKKAKELGFTVLLSGNGGDELFYGYKSHNDYALGLELLSKQKYNFPVLNKSKGFKVLMYHFHKLITTKNNDSLLSKINIRSDYSVLKELSDLALKQSIPFDRSDWHRQGFEEKIDDVYYFLNYAWLTNNCYFLSDKLAMSNSIEVRSPFSDIELINFVDTLPLEFKFKNQQPKKILKDSLKGVIPDYVLNRKKTGFTPPSSFIDSIVQNYTNSFFKENSNTFSHLVTDYFANQL